MMSIPDEYMIQIGRVVVASAELEASLHRTFTLLASEKPAEHLRPREFNVVVDVLLADDNLSQQIERLRMLAARTITINGERTTGAINRVVEDDMAASLAGLIKRCDRAREKRNAIVHATWSTDSDLTVWRKTKRRLRMESQVVLLDDLRVSAQEIEDAVQASLNFHYQVLAGVIHTDWGVMPGLES